jgi:hypothetical protein
MSSTIPSLESAAEQLVIAAQQTVSSSITKQNGKILTALEDIRRHSQSAADQKHPSPADLKTSTDAITTTIVAAIENAKAETIAAIERSRKIQSLQWAIANVSVGHFTCYKPTSSAYNFEKTTSADIVKRILCHFMRGCGSYVDNYYLESPAYGRQQDGLNEKFFEALVEHIHLLTGQKPRLEKGKDGDKTAIYYV